MRQQQTDTNSDTSEDKIIFSQGFNENKYTVKNDNNGNNSMLIVQLSKSDENKYWCEATNKLATVSSQHVFIRVHSELIIG